jgi:hypothetical protein
MTVLNLARLTARKIMPGTLRSKLRSIVARLRRPAKVLDVDQTGVTCMNENVRFAGCSIEA